MPLFHAIFAYASYGRCLTGQHVCDATEGSNELFLRDVKRKLQASGMIGGAMGKPLHMRFYSITDMGAITKFPGIHLECKRETRELWIRQLPTVSLIHLKNTVSRIAIQFIYQLI